MTSLVDFFADDRLVVATANIGALLALVAIGWTTGKFLWAFCRTAYHDNIRAAFHSMRRSNVHLARTCSNDVVILIAVLSIQGALIMVSLGGMLLMISGILLIPSDNQRLAASGNQWDTYQSILAQIGLTIFAITFFLSVIRAITLSFLVARFRLRRLKRNSLLRGQAITEKSRAERESAETQH